MLKKMFIHTARNLSIYHSIVSYFCCSTASDEKVKNSAQ